MPCPGRCSLLLASVVLVSSFFAPLSAVDSAPPVTWSAAHQPLALALAKLAQLTAAVPQPDYALATSEAALTPITCVLTNANPATVNQAIAHAAGGWWSPSADDADIVLTTSPQPPRGPLSVRTHPSSRTDAATEATVRALLSPWLGPGDRFHPGEAAIAPDPLKGNWIATLDDHGRAQLVEILSFLQQAVPFVPPLVPDAQTPDPTAEIALDLPAGAWQPWIAQLATATQLSVSLAPGIDDHADAPAVTFSGQLRALSPALRDAGLENGIVAGALCLARHPVADRLHPALRRRLAVVPVGHLARDDEHGLALAERLRAAFARETWSEPGWELRWLPSTAALLIAADPRTIHQALDRLDDLDRDELRLPGNPPAATTSP